MVRILEATGVKFQWDEHLAGAEAFERYQEYIPSELYQSIERNRVALKGTRDDPDWRRLLVNQRDSAQAF